MSSIVVAHGLAFNALPGDEQGDTTKILRQIENLCFSFISELLRPGTRSKTARTGMPAAYDVAPGTALSPRRLTNRTWKSFMRTWGVLAKVHELLRVGRRVSQRELYYMLVHMFKLQIELNRTVSKVSTILGVPRYALNIDAASRGVLAGCVTLALTGSHYCIDCRHVGCVS